MILKMRLDLFKKTIRLHDLDDSKQRRETIIQIMSLAGKELVDPLEL